MAGFACCAFVMLHVMAIITLEGADLNVESKATQHVTIPGNNVSGASAKPPRLIPAENDKSKHHFQINTAHGCPNCNNNNSKDDFSQEWTIKKLRIEMIKAKILAKLQLDRAPVAKGNPKQSRIVALLSNLNLIQDESDENQAKDSEDHGKTTEVIVFSKNAKVPPLWYKRNSSANLILLFDLEQNSLSSSVRSALLWVHMRKSRRRELHGKFLHIQALSEETGRGNIEMQDVKVAKSKVKKEQKSGSGWIVVDVKDIVQHWFNKTAPYFNATERPVHALEISCQDCETETSQLISSRGRLRPFLVIDLEKPKALSRKKRQSRVCSSDTTECCRESLYVNFTEIGWDWIIFPKGFRADYCKGLCESEISRLRKYSFILDHKNVKVDVACCTPTKMLNLSVLYRGDNGQFVRKTVSDMKVDTCGCSK